MDKKSIAYSEWMWQAMSSACTDDAEGFIATQSLFITPEVDPIELWLNHFAAYCLRCTTATVLRRMIQFLIDFTAARGSPQPTRAQYRHILHTISVQSPSDLNAFKLHMLRIHRKKFRPMPNPSEVNSTILNNNDPPPKSLINSREGISLRRPRRTKSFNNDTKADKDRVQAGRSLVKPITVEPIIFRYHPAQIVDELAKKEVELFLEIQAWDLLMYQRHGAGKSKDDAIPPKLSPVSALVQRFDMVSLWVATEILRLHSTKEQTRAVDVFLRMAERCQQTHNYNTLMEMLSGLNHASIARLKDVWADLPTARVATFKQLEKLMAPSRNFNRYRSALSHAMLAPLPYVGVYLHDITFILDGNSRYADNYVDSSFVSMMHEQFAEIRKFQRQLRLGSTQFEGSPSSSRDKDKENHDYQTMLFSIKMQPPPSSADLGSSELEQLQGYISELPYIEDEDELFALSLQRQPSSRPTPRRDTVETSINTVLEAC